MGIRDVGRGMRAVAGLFADAETEADRDGRPEVGAEHLVLAALRDPDGSGARALAMAGGTPDGFRDALAEVHAEALAGLGVTAVPPRREVPDVVPGRGHHRLSPGARRLFHAVATARSSCSDGRALGAQVMLALAAERSGPAPAALARMGVESDALAHAARSVVTAR
jgi:ATP-dependent Clp protease ATP-binding subunit ClpA